MITIDLDEHGRGRVNLPTREVHIAGHSLADGRDQALRVIVGHARDTGTPVTADVTGDSPTTLTITPDGEVSENPSLRPAVAPQAPATNTPPPAASLTREETETPAPVAGPEDPDTVVLGPAGTRAASPSQDDPIPPRPDAPPEATSPVTTSLQNLLEEQPASSSPPARTSFVRETTPPPTEGMQSVVYKLTGGLWNLGPGQAEQYKSQLHNRAAKPIQGTRNVTFMCLKGGISKTSTTLGVGLTLAEHRPDSVLAIDANPDAGDLADRALSHEQVEAVSPRTITDLVHAIEAGQIQNLTDLNRYTQTSGRLHLLAGEQDPAVSESLTAEEYIDVRDVADRFYPLTLTDCGTGVTHPAMKGILENAQQIVVASGWAVTGAKRAERTLTWLHQAHNGAYADLARNAVVVLTDTGTTSKDIDRDQIVDTLGNLCRAVHLVPFDPAVAKGDLVRLPDLRQQTQQAYLEVGATIIDAL